MPTVYGTLHPVPTLMHAWYDPRDKGILEERSLKFHCLAFEIAAEDLMSPAHADGNFSFGFLEILS